jgi:hypothetical protein
LLVQGPDAALVPAWLSRLRRYSRLGVGLVRIKILVRVCRLQIFVFGIKIEVFRLRRDGRIAVFGHMDS